MVGIVKPRTERRRGDREATDRVVLPGVKDPVRLPHNSGALRVLQAIRDEVHDTAVRYHRFVRDKRSLTSALERLPGIGAARRTALLQRFGSAEAVALASEDELAAVPGIGPAVARRVKAALDAAAPPQGGPDGAADPVEEDLDAVPDEGEDEAGPEPTVEA
jgi:excinuclease ABC subunit C